MNHNTAPLEIRERVSFSSEQLEDALPALAERAVEGVILSTCNRTEVYSVTVAPSTAGRETRRFLADYHGLELGSVEPYLYDSTGSDAARHLFRVASGLDSMILGESQILGQVREALRAAAESRSLRTPVSRLFHRAIRTGRRVREETDLGRNALSISYAGVQLAERVLGRVRGRRALLIGAGEAGQLVARALRTSGAADLAIANRTPRRAEDLARQLGGRTVPYEQVGEHLGEFDIAIAATESPRPVLTWDMVVSAAASRPQHTMFLLDLSVPRNIEPEASSVDGVGLFNIDDLSSIAEENLESRKAAATDAEVIVEEELARFMGWWESLDAVPIIKGIRRRADDIRRRELARALRELSASPQQTEVLDAMTRSIVSKLLHDPTMALKERSDQTHLQAARDLFRVPESE